MNIYAQFYQDCFEKFNGYIPLWPLNSETALGDIIIFQNGKMIKIGNIMNPYFRIDQKEFLENEGVISRNSWNLQFGVRQSFKSRTAVEQSQNKNEAFGLRLKFDTPGAYIFHAINVRSKSILNFEEIKFKLLQLLTAMKCSFNNLCVVTSVAEMPESYYAFAKDSNGQLFISSTSQDGPLYNFNDLGRSDYEIKIELMKSIGAYSLGTKGGTFFKAQQLGVSSRGMMKIKKYLTEFWPAMEKEQLDHIRNQSAIQCLPIAEMKPTSVLELFEFRPMNWNDVTYFLGNRNKQ